jgi:hypothetical protein
MHRNGLGDDKDFVRLKDVRWDLGVEALYGTGAHYTDAHLP